MVKTCVYRLTHCDSGLRLNVLMQVFLYLTFVFSVAMLIGDPSVQVTVLYSETVALGQGALNLWGVVGASAIILHVLGLLLRGMFGIRLMEGAMFCGFFVWLWATVIYLNGGFIFQFLVSAVPNLLFWGWYAWQWRVRYKNPGDKNVKAFV